MVDIVACTFGAQFQMHLWCKPFAVFTQPGPIPAGNNQQKSTSFTLTPGRSGAGLDLGPAARTHAFKPQGQGFQRIEGAHDLFGRVERRVVAQRGVDQGGGVLVAVGIAHIVGILRGDLSQNEEPKSSAVAARPYEAGEHC